MGKKRLAPRKEERKTDHCLPESPQVPMWENSRQRGKRKGRGLMERERRVSKEFRVLESKDLQNMAGVEEPTGDKEPKQDSHSSDTNDSPP